MGKLFILSVEEDDLETVEKIMALIESAELVICTDISSAPPILLTAAGRELPVSFTNCAIS